MADLQNTDALQAIKAIAEKHNDDEQFQKDFNEDSHAAVEKHMGSDVLNMVKEHLDTGKIQETIGNALKDGKLDVEKIVSNIGSFFK